MDSTEPLGVLARSVIGMNDDSLEPFSEAVVDGLLRQQKYKFAHFFITSLVCHRTSLT
jgi:hypothetical protein